jgi:hypothetical protein
MTDMQEHGASGRTGPLPPSESHDGFLELCATATTGSLNAEERRRLKEHLAQCESCREILAQYEAIIDRVIPVWVPDLTEERRTPSGWSLEEAEAQLFARLGEPDRLPNQQEFPELKSPPASISPPTVRTFSGDVLWRHLWVQFAAALLLVAALGIIAYRTGVGRGLILVLRGSASDTSLPDSGLPNEPAISASDRTPALENGMGAQLAALRTQFKERLAEIKRLKAQQAQTERDLSLERASRISQAQERAALSERLELTKGSLESLQQKLDSATSENSEDSALTAALQLKVDQLTESMRDRHLEIARERELLDHDRDIRELMGSRDLYIAEVYDVAKTGLTQKPFGRVFYTTGKSLIFYAYDLDQQPGIEQTSTFQAWGRRGQDHDHAVNLGIFYQDNKTTKRWVLKSDDPKTLGQIDEVFVTVEPNGGSVHPSGKPLLFAYLRIQPNHP